MFTFNTPNFTVDSTGSTSTMRFRNRIINGDMRVNQRNNQNVASTFGTTSMAFVADRWILAKSAFLNSTQATSTQGSFVGATDLPFTDAGIQTSVRMIRLQGTTSTNDLFIAYNFENQDCIQLIGVPLTLSFYAKASANSTASTVSGSMYYGSGVDQNGVNDLTNYRSLAGTVATISGANRNTWRRYTVTITVPTMIPDATTSLPTTTPTTQFGVMIHVAYTASSTGATNDFVEVTGIQLERGVTATPFELRPLQLELQLCQRYFERIALAESGGIIFAGYNVATGTMENTMICSSKRTAIGTISATDYSINGQFNNSSLAIAHRSRSTVAITWTVPVTGATFVTFNYIDINAEILT